MRASPKPPSPSRALPHLFARCDPALKRRLVEFAARRATTEGHCLVEAITAYMDAGEFAEGQAAEMLRAAGISSVYGVKP
jgi:hypothetical protein